MKRLFVCEKHDQALRYSILLNDDDLIILCPAVVSYVFDYPENLKFKDLPYSDLQPQYKNNPSAYNQSEKSWFPYQYKKAFDKKGFCLHKILTSYYEDKCIKENQIECREFESYLNNDQFIHSKEQVHELFASFDEIIYTCDSDHTGLRGFDFMFERHYEIENLSLFCKQNKISLTAIWNRSGMDKASILKAFEERTDFNNFEYIEKARTIYQNKDFFEYNYNLNSLMLINKSYFLAKGEYPKHVLTKNFILTLNICKQKQEGFKIFKVFDSRHIGHPASRAELIDKLIQLELLEDKNKVLSLTPIGYKLLDNLHRKLDDPFLGNRLNFDYENLSHEEFKEKYSKYLSFVFSKQKRFINKIS